MDQTAIQNASPVFQNWVQGGPPMNRNRLSSGATEYSRDSLEGLHFLHAQTSPRLSHPMLEKSMEDDADRESPSLRKKLADGLRPLTKSFKRASKAVSSELESDEQYDTFEQDVDLSRTSRDITHSSEARVQPSHYHDQWSSQQTPEKHNFQQQHKRTYDNSNHDGGASIISSLSADDTNYELDDKTVKSIDASISNRSRGKTVNSRSSRQSKAGRDFNGAFDDLVEMTLNKKDLLDDSFDEIYEYQEQHDLMRQHEIRVQQSTPQHKKAVSSVALDDVFEAQLYQQQRQQKYDLVDHRIKKPQHRRCVTSASSTNPLLERPRPLHARVSSEFPVSRPAPLSQFNRISSCGSSQQRTVAPHATLREVISAHNKVSDFAAASPGRRKLIPSTNRPPTLETARSTSNTVLSSTADTVASCPNQQLGVWNGFECGDSHPLNNSPKSFRRSQTFGPETPCHTTPCHRSMGSAATSLMSQDMYSMDKSSHSYINPSSKYSLQGHVRSASESVNSQIQEATGEFDEESELTEETESTKKSIASSIRGELKYQLKKIVPSPLRKKMGRYPRNKVKFDRTGDGHLV